MFLDNQEEHNREQILKKFRQVSFTYGSETRILSHTFFLMVQSDVDLSAVCLDEKPHEETSEGVSSATGQDRAGGFRETTTHPSQRKNYWMEVGW